jgi:hypothetical protein
VSVRAFLGQLWDNGGASLFGFVMMVAVILGALITALL